MLRIDQEDAAEEDIERLIEAATAQIDGPSGWLGRALITQTLELRLDSFYWLGRCRWFDGYDGIPLPYPPFGAVTSVKYDDTSGVEQTVDPSLYRVVGAVEQPRLLCRVGQSWPRATFAQESIRIRYTAGYGATPENVPAPIRQAILVMVQQSYSLSERNLFTSAETVDGVGSAQFIVTDNAARVMRDAAENLLSTFRVFG